MADLDHLTRTQTGSSQEEQDTSIHVELTFLALLISISISLDQPDTIQASSRGTCPTCDDISAIARLLDRIAFIT
jgi:hypothetical protein